VDVTGANADTDRRLPCGRTEESLLDAAVEAGALLDAHQQGCPHCRAALQVLRARWSAMVAADDVQVPPGLIERMVSRVRSGMGEPGYVEIPAPRGRLRIAQSVLEDIVSQVVAEHGLPVLGCRASQTTEGLSVEVRVVMRHRTAAARAAQSARLAVIAAVHEWTGLDVRTVDVAVVDVDLD
jgi:uncharacterized alkaline shock family protein YloU